MNADEWAETRNEMAQSDRCALSGGIIRSLDCFLVRNIIFRCSETLKDMTTFRVGVLPCSTDLGK